MTDVDSGKSRAPMYYDKASKEFHTDKDRICSWRDPGFAQGDVDGNGEWYNCGG